MNKTFVLTATMQSTIRCKNKEDPLEVLAHFVRYLIAMEHPPHRLVVVVDDETGSTIYKIPLGLAQEGMGAITRIAAARNAANDNWPDIARAA
jgi:hypothetical protein